MLPICTMDVNFSPDAPDFEILVEKAPVGICKTGLDGVLSYANEKLCDMLGMSKNELIGRNYLDFYTSDNNSAHVYWKNLFLAGKLPRFTGWVDLQRPDGGICPCHLTMQNVTDIWGNTQFYIGILDNIEEEQKVQQVLYEERVRLQQDVSSAIIKAQEDERKFLAEELHDNINQLLATTRLFIDSAKISDPELTKELLERSSENIGLIIDELRVLSRSLTPPDISDIGLIQSLEGIIGDVQMLSGIQIQLKADQFDEEKLSSDKKLVVYRILQEQINNIIKHARARNVHVLLQNEGAYVQITIEDDGKGFKPEASNQGMGLKNIRSRAALYNGQAQIQSAPGKGCKLFVEFEN